MSSRIRILAVQLGCKSFLNSIKRLVMSVVFALLAVGVMLAARWVLLTQIRIL